MSDGRVECVTGPVSSYDPEKERLLELWVEAANAQLRALAGRDHGKYVWLARELAASGVKRVTGTRIQQILGRARKKTSSPRLHNETVLAISRYLRIPTPAEIDQPAILRLMRERMERVLEKNPNAEELLRGFDAMLAELERPKGAK